jgi:hypothetical protein
MAGVYEVALSVTIVIPNVTAESQAEADTLELADITSRLPYGSTITENE